VGLAVFAVAFFLPSVAQGSGSPLKGWQCAVITLSALIEARTWHSLMFLAALSGLINILILPYLVFTLIPPLRASSALRLVRTVLADLILLCMIATWVFFLTGHFVPLIGHALWIVGALLILSAEPRRRMPTTVA
jgi:hypothetical protein